MVTAILLLLFALNISCLSRGGNYNGPDTDREKVNPEIKEEFENIPFQITAITPQDGAESVAVGGVIGVETSVTVNPQSLKPDLIEVINDKGEKVPGIIRVFDKSIFFHPILKFYNSPKGMISQGMKVMTTYRLIIHDGIEDIKERRLPPKELSFTTTDLDFGLYWCNKEVNCIKYNRDHQNPFYRADLPVMLFAHGWQPGASLGSFVPQIPFLVGEDVTTTTVQNTAKLWQERGFNIGFFLWQQFADEMPLVEKETIVGVTAAEAKIWSSENNYQKMRYKLPDDSYRDFKLQKSIGNLLHDEYIDALGSNVSGNIRLVGHSLGAQVVTAISELVFQKVQSGDLSSHLIPKRIALLDPFWSQGKKKYLKDQRTGGKTCEIYTNMIEKYELILEIYKTSDVVALVGDNNNELHKMAASYHLKADFLSKIELSKEHKYAFEWYFLSMGANNFSHIGGALASDATIKAKMNFYTDQVAYFLQTKGIDTPEINDDHFIRKTDASELF